MILLHQISIARRRARQWTLAILLALPIAGSAQLFRLKTREYVEAKNAESAAAAAPARVAPIKLPAGRAAIPQNLTLLNAPGEGNPLAPFWNERNFVKSFAGSYGYRSDIEPPKPTTVVTNAIGGTNEVAFFNFKLFPLMTNDVSAAIKLLEENINTNVNAVFDYTLGNLYFQKADHENAARAYGAAIEKFPNYLRAHKNRAISYMGLERFDDAIPALTRTIDLGGGDGHIYGLLGVCLLKRGNYIGAEGAYRNAMMLLPEQKDWKMGLLTCQIEQGKLTAANTFLESLLGENPDDAGLWNIQASLQMQMEAPDQAAVSYEILRKLGKANLSNLMLLGDIYMSREAPALALPVYLEAIEKDGVKNLRSSLRAAGILAGSGAWDETAAILEKIRKTHGDNIKGDEDLELLKLDSRVALAKGDGARAAKLLEQVVEKNPLDGEALLMIGDFHAAPPEEETEDEAKLRKAKADHRYELASKIEGFAADAFVKRAQLKVREREYDQAIDFLNKAQKVRHRENIQTYLEAVQRAARKRS